MPALTVGVAVFASAAVPPAHAASVFPLDPMYLLLFGGGNAPAAGDDGSSAAAPGGRWRIVTHSISRFFDPGDPSPVDFDDLAFRPRFVAAPGTLSTLQRTAVTGGRWSGDLYAQRTVIGNAHGAVHLIGGIKVGVLGADGLGGAGEGTLVNTAQLAPPATATLVGPMLGIAGEGQLQHHRVRGVFQQSKLYGNAELTRSAAGAEGIDGLRSGVESFVERRDVNVTVSELGLTYQYDLTERVAFGMGAMASVWWDLPGNAGRSEGAADPEVYLGGMGTLEMKF